MWNLIKLEMRKNRMLNDLLGIVIANFSVFLWLFICTLPVFNIKVNGEYVTFLSQNILISIVSVLFAIYGSMMFITMYSEQFSLGTIKNDFVLPYSRKKLIMSKLYLSLIFTLINIVLSYLIQNRAFVVFSSLFQKYDGLNTAGMINFIPILFLGLLTATAAIIISAVISFFNKTTVINVILSIIVCFIVIAPIVSSEEITFIGNLTFSMRLATSIGLLLGSVLLFGISLKKEVKKDISI